MLSLRSHAVVLVVVADRVCRETHSKVRRAVANVVWESQLLLCIGAVRLIRQIATMVDCGMSTALDSNICG